MLLLNTKAYLDGAFENTDMRIENDKVTLIKKGITPEKDEQVMDFAGDYLVPGFTDVHIHAFMGMDTMGGEEAVRHMSRELKKVGVQAFCPTTMSASPEDTLKALRGIKAVMDKPEKDGATVLGAHMEAPFMSKEKCGAQLPEFFVLPTMAAFDEMTGECKKIVRLISLAPELEGALEFIAALSERGITVSLGHTSANAKTVHDAAEAGATHVTHTFNAQTPLKHREPGVPGAALCDDRLYTEFIADGVHLHPDILRIAVRCKGKEKIVLITDAMEAAGMPDGQYELGGQTVFVKDGAARLESGTLAGSTLLLRRAVSNMATWGIPFEEIVPMATQTPADSINVKSAPIAVGARPPFNRFNAQGQYIQTIL